MAVVLGFTVHTRKNRKNMSSFWQRNGPVLLVCLAIPLILADILRHVLQDEGYWPAHIYDKDGNEVWWGSAEYKDGEAETTSDENMSHLSTIGILFTVVCTYSGFILLAVGTLWNANIHQKWGKIKAKWALLRRKAAARSGAKAAPSSASTADSLYVQVDGQ